MVFAPFTDRPGRMLYSAAVDVIFCWPESDGQSSALMTDDVTVEFAADGIRRLAEIAYSVNEKTENIGARRLYTVMEKLLEEVSFSAGEQASCSVKIDAAYVDAKLGELAVNEDLSRYVL